ncbi:tetratricopeptide repeat protein [Rhodonellum sp.]|uniref:tetratricopeptide repeat protein n=1 Tax=Rhodonellum sp. TaxID=2231180 RepID=UPI002725250C|nr:tetratricopeptide repeat protein [Rhodonellum sp.]MDO9553802.1 tetratricopeptide repeat protein [Rhodonellum sp.]
MSRFDKGVAFFSEGKFEEALEVINNCIAEEKGNTEYYSFRARVLSRLGRFDASLLDFDYLVEMEPYNTNFISDRAVVLHLLQRHQESLEEFDRALNLDPKNPYRYSSRAFLKDRIGDFQGAIEDYEKAIELDPEDAVAYNNKGMVEEKLGYVDFSKKSFEKADALVGKQPNPNSDINQIPADSENIEKKNGLADHTAHEQQTQSKLSFQHFLGTFLKVLGDKNTRAEFLKFVKSRFKKKTD